MNKSQLCEAFCGELRIREVPAGFAVTTAFKGKDGDALGFFVTRHPNAKDRFRLEDSGLLVPFIEATGTNLESGTRHQLFQQLLAEYGSSFDEDSMELQSEYVTEAEVPATAVRFVALLLRVQDLAMLSPDHVESTFRDDVRAALLSKFSAVADVQFDVPPTEQLQEFQADALVRPRAGGTPVAVYFATREARVDEAVMLWMETRWTKTPVKIALVLENLKAPTISARTLRRAQNRLDAVPVFRGDEAAAMERVAHIAGIQTGSLH